MTDTKNAARGRLWTLCPWSGEVSTYDKEHLTLYARLLDASAEGANQAEMARAIFGFDLSNSGDRALQIVESHLARAIWMTEHGYPALNW
jgi:hypothetical protein